MTISEDRVRGLAQAADALAGELGLASVLTRIVAAAAHATGARYAALGVIGDDESLAEFVYRGVDEETAAEIGHLPRGKGLLGLLIREPRIVRTDDINAHPASYGFPPGHPPMTTFLGAPVRSSGKVFGNLYLTDKEGGFDAVDEDLILVLAAQAGTAIENAQLADKLQSLAVQDERERISRDLHDGIIQALFSIGMGLESARGLLHRDPERVGVRLDEAVDALDDTIRELRNYIFRLRPHDAAAMGLTGGIRELAREFEVNTVVRPELVVDHDIDAQVPAVLVPDILQIVREALSNCAKHAEAGKVTIQAVMDKAAVELSVSDDGVGFETGFVQVGRGLDNIRERAQALAADLEVDSAPGAGTVLRLRVPAEG